MYKVEYSAKALNDLLYLKKYISENHGDNTAGSAISTITKDIRRLEVFPVSGHMVSDILEVPTDYYYLYSMKNYVFYRFDDDIVKIVRVFNEQRDYIKILYNEE